MRYLKDILKTFGFLISLLVMPDQGWSDTSELSLTFEGGTIWRRQPTHFSDNQVKWSSITQSSQIGQSLGTRIGFGLSFAFEAWMALRWEELGQVELMNTQSTRCIDARSHLCTRSMTLHDLSRGIIEFGSTYRPFDHWSPMIAISTGVSYTPAEQVLEVIEGQTDLSSWTPLAQGMNLHLDSFWGWRSRLSIGMEVRIKSRWGVRLAGWGAIELVERTFIPPSVGLSISTTYYQYVRFW